MARRSPNTKKGRGGGGGGASHSQSSHGSQSHSPQDSVNTEAILSKLAKAKEIESSLDAAEAERRSTPKRGKSTPASDEKSQALRLQLCGMLSDAIILDPVLADSSDAIGRLWKVCFYGRINDIRGRIVRERGRAKKRAAAGAQGGEADAVAGRRAVENLERQLKKFLGEAVQLYRYLIERYVKELMPLSQTQGSAGSDAEEEERSRVVVSSLYRMHIHLGDLHRYSSSQNKEAEECYLASARLALGTGNPFNQLAVVAQQSSEPMTAAALYYYARSLMACRSPFETSRSNLVRLFEANRRWLEEHSRDDDDEKQSSRGIVDIFAGDAEKGGKKQNTNKDHRGRDKKKEKEWRQKERAALGRKALARFVDLQWDFFRGVSLGIEDDDGRIDLDGLAEKVRLSSKVFGELISAASFGEGLLRKLVAVLAFSTLGASESGKPINATGFDARRAGDSGWNEGIVVTNQALAFGFLLRFCAVLARDVDALVAKREDAIAGADNLKLGAIRSFSPLLLGFRFVACMYEGRSEWFHGLPFFPAGGLGGDNELGGAVHEMCKVAHAEFWKSISALANRLEALPNKKKNKGGDLTEDFDEFRGYVPFASFLDKANDMVAASGRKRGRSKYATADEALCALAETKSSGGRGGEAETWSRIDLFLSIADGKTASSNDGGAGDSGPHFLTKDADTNRWEFSTGDGGAEEEGNSPEWRTDTASLPVVRYPDSADMDVNDAAQGGVEEVDVLIQADENEVAPAKNSDAVPFLLTPAALLAGVSSCPSERPKNNNESKKSPPPSTPIDSILAAGMISATKQPSNLNNPIAPTKIRIDFMLDNALQAKQPEPAKAPLLPPPGFSMQPSAPAPCPPLQPLAATPLAPTMTGISLADFTTTSMLPPPKNNVAAFGTNQATRGMMPQAGQNYSAESNILFETLNPFAQQHASMMPSFSNNNFISAAPNSESGLNQPPPGLLSTPAQGGVNHFHQPHSGTNKGLDPTLDFLLSNNRQTAPDEIATSNAFNLLVPSSTAEPDDPSESILNFLFDSTNHDSSSQSRGRPLYAAAGQHGQVTHNHGMPRTKNPFAT
eukprot:CAMPEP_0181131376 /NCGR_PEP_ID=MMETSP1071-20121207/30391_1 /TAXON_ID=35127 /ORGANISM="Thalassiosira sp., Strain NH16" /LENGTH=1073 /DNA_ID=CAMNT_0023217563 /DNA_START=168 /DNA_END=3389 /DNA_ORIENTATION=+